MQYSTVPLRVPCSRTTPSRVKQVPPSCLPHVVKTACKPRVTTSPPIFPANHRQPQTTPGPPSSVLDRPACEPSNRCPSMPPFPTASATVHYCTTESPITHRHHHLHHLFHSFPPVCNITTQTEFFAQVLACFLSSYSATLSHILLTPLPRDARH